MATSIAFWGMSTIGTVLFIVGVAYLLKYIGVSFVSGLPGSRQAALVLGIGALVIGAATGSGPLSETLSVSEDEPAEPAEEQIFEWQDITGETHVTEVKSGNVVQVRYTVSGGNVEYAGDDSELDTVKFAADVWNADEENDRGATILSVNDQVENEDDDDSPWDIIDLRDDDTDNFAITPSGGSTNYGEASLLVSNYSTKEVEMAFEPNDTALQKVELYDTVTVDAKLEDSEGRHQETITIEFQRVD